MKKHTVRTEFGEVRVQESEGKGAPVLLIHGNSLGAESFSRQLSGSPGKEFRTVAFDLPGHGDSPKAGDPQRTYCLSAYAAIARELVDLLDLRDPAVVGHSLGGHIALQAAAAGLKPRSLMIFGTPPIGNPSDFPTAFRADGPGDAMFRAGMSPEEAARIAAVFMPPEVLPPPYFAKSIAATDPAARECLGASIGRDTLADERTVVGSLQVPLAVLHGEFDRVANIDYIRALHVPSLWRGCVQVIRGAGHCPQYDAPEAFNGLLLEFLSGMAG